MNQSSPARRFSNVRVFSLKFFVLLLPPMLLLLGAAEATVRVKYFLAHDYDWNYLTTPFVRSAPAPPKGVSFAGSATVHQIVFQWPKPCVSGQVYSTERNALMPRTWDSNCFRGDHVVAQKDAAEYRIVFLGGSTVQDYQSDEEMMTAQAKRSLRPDRQGKRITVVNAGVAGFNSRDILHYYRSKVGAFAPDLILYYEAWNEMPRDVKPMSAADRTLRTLNGWLHKALHYRLMLYTYLIEKRAFREASKQHFWKLDVNVVRDHFTALVDEIRDHGVKFVFVTQVVDWPRMWKGVDTFDWHAVDALLDRLRADPSYRWDIREISALNQRLALFYELELCRVKDVPIVNILEPVEAVGDAGRAELFMDGIHLTVKGDRVVGALIGRGVNLAE